MTNYIIYTVFFLLGTVFSILFFMLFYSKLQKMISNDFSRIANETIKSEQADLRKQNREAIEEKIIPLTHQLNEFKDKVDKFNISGAENTIRILEQIQNLEKNNKQIEEETKNLTKALTKNQNVKGAYGENILDTILQNSGMVEGIHYFKQYNTYSDNLMNSGTHKIRPDVVINLPNNRHLVIDSKVTLSSYLEYIKDNTKLKDFKAEVKNRIIDLANKNYQKAYGINQPDFVLMYMPIESSVNLLYEDAEIIELAYKANVIITGTASLLVAIRLVNQLFACNKQNESIKQIVNAGTNLYETFVLFCEELIDIQKQFDGLSGQFTTLINRYKRTNKNNPSLFSQVKALKELGITTGMEIPSMLLNEELSGKECEAVIND